jgi:hypothetical protein
MRRENADVGVPPPELACFCRFSSRKRTIFDDFNSKIADFEGSNFDDFGVFILPILGEL